MTVFVGVDPGGTWTGVVAREGDRLLDAEVLNRTTGEAGVGWAAHVISAIEVLAAEHENGASGLVVAVESVVAPTGHLGKINLGGLLGTAMVFGAVIGRYPAAVTIAPGGHGSALLLAYPAGLRAQREKRGTGKWRHARSAWDIAGAAQFLARVDTR